MDKSLDNGGYGAVRWSDTDSLDENDKHCENAESVETTSHKPQNRSNLPLLFLIFIGIGIAMVLTIYSDSNSHAIDEITTTIRPPTAEPTSLTPISTNSALSWTLKRDGYDPLSYFTSNASSFLKYKFFEDNNYNAIIEPNAPMVLSVEDIVDYSYSIRVSNSKDPSDFRVGTLWLQDGNIEYMKISFDCEPFDEFDVTITETGSTTTSQYTGKAVCMYVRREIRDLSDSDLSATMDAMYVLWSTSDEVGQQLYGEDFHNITYLLEMHHFNAAWPDSDHFHEGNGFLAQHIKMTNVFEQVLQLINPSLSLPYWDFTIDSHDGIYPYESPIFSESMFGSMRVPLDSEMDGGYTYQNNSIVDFAILDGRWAFTKSEMNPDKFAGLEGGYGYMRSPWNMNPSPYVSRFTGISNMPKCSAYLKMLEYTDLIEFANQIEVGPHASVHGDNGGKFGCDLFDPLVAMGALKDETEKMSVCSMWIFTLKGIYRNNMIIPKVHCAIPDDINEAYCPFVCTAGVESDLEDLLFQKLISSSVPKDMTIDQKQSWIDFVCGGDAARVFAGDHAESASPSDPSFWPIHPTLERLYQAKMMVGGFDTTAWSTNASSSTVCVHHECYEDGVLGSLPFCCYGHYENDQMLDFVTGDVSSTWGPTNGETIVASDPTRSDYTMPYIYDSFSWDHCADESGGDIDTKLESLYAEKFGSGSALLKKESDTSAVKTAKKNEET